jgi:[ribosomal protein S18]-alanine N-acetyltransferase
MSVADLDVVVHIENRAYSFPWTRGIFSDCLTAGHECRLACLDDEVIGHAVMSAAAGESHLLNVCIKRELQGTGLGREFLHHLIGRARILGAQVLFLEVRPSNRVALRLYDTLGFSQVGVRKEYYPGELAREDAWVMALPLVEDNS